MNKKSIECNPYLELWLAFIDAFLSRELKLWQVNVLGNSLNERIICDDVYKLL